MSAFSLANLFGGKPAQSAPVQQPMQQQQQQPMQTQPGNIPADAANNMQSPVTAGTAPNGAVPAATPPVDKAASPELEKFKDIWNIEPNANAPNGQLFDISQEKMLEAARKQNFTSQIPQETLTKMAAGGTEGVAAMMEVIQMATQNAYAQSAFATTKLIEAGLKQGNYAKTSDIDSKVKSMSLQDSLRSDNPLFTNPAVTPMLDMVQNQLMQKFPQATPAELKGMAMEYLTGFAGAINAPERNAQEQAKAQTVQGEDWGKYLSMQ